MLEKSKQAQVAPIVLFHQDHCMIDIITMLDNAKASQIYVVPIINS